MKLITDLNFWLVGGCIALIIITLLVSRKIVSAAKEDKPTKLLRRAVLRLGNPVGKTFEEVCQVLGSGFWPRSQFPGKRVVVSWPRSHYCFSLVFDGTGHCLGQLGEMSFPQIRKVLGDPSYFKLPPLRPEFSEQMKTKELTEIVRILEDPMASTALYRGKYDLLEDENLPIEIGWHELKDRYLPIHVGWYENDDQEEIRVEIRKGKARHMLQLRLIDDLDEWGNWRPSNVF